MYERHLVNRPDDLDLMGLPGDFDDFGLFEGEDYWDVEELFGEEFPWGDEAVDLAEILRGALIEGYGDAFPEELDEALLNMFDSLSPAESFNLSKALSQIEKGAAQVMADPRVGQIAAVVLPVAGGALGTYVGGPAGTALGAQLGSAAAKALPKNGKVSSTASKVAAATPAHGQPQSTKPPAAGGSAAAAQGLVLSQQPEVLKSLLALALGEHGRKSIDGVPVGAVMNLLSTIFGQAAADADELLYSSEEMPAYLFAAEEYPADPATPGDRAQALYATLLGAENESLSEAAGW